MATVRPAAKAAEMNRPGAGPQNESAPPWAWDSAPVRASARIGTANAGSGTEDSRCPLAPDGPARHTAGMDQERADYADSDEPPAHLVPLWEDAITVSGVLAGAALAAALSWAIYCSLVD